MTAAQPERASAPAVTLVELAARFGGTPIGDATRRIMGLAPLDQAGPTQLAFLANPKYLPQVDATRAAAVLITAADLERVADRSGSRCAFIVTPNPYAYFARVAQWFAAAAEPAAPVGVDPSACVDASAQLGDDVSVGPHAVIEAGARIGARVRIGAGVFVGRDARIGDDARLYPRVTIYAGCKLGARAIVHAGAVIGADGFGFAPDFDGSEGDARGEWVKIPQVGAVSIGDDVEIGANTTIDRGAMADTVIEQGVKIDNLVQIAHNCRIGAYTVIAACAGIAGSTTIGRHCMIGGAVGIAGHVTLADRVIVTAKSGVSKSLTKAGVYTSAFPAIDNADWNRNAVLMRNLDKMRDRLKHLEAAVAALQQQ